MYIFFLVHPVGDSDYEDNDDLDVDVGLEYVDEDTSKRIMCFTLTTIKQALLSKSSKVYSPKWDTLYYSYK